MFSAKTTTEQTKTINYEPYYCEYHNLPDRTILQVTRKTGVTNFTLFSVDDFNKPLAENNIIVGSRNSLVGGGDYYKVIGILKGVILINAINGHSQPYQLITLCTKTLKSLSTQVWDGYSNVGVINNQSFFVFKKTDIQTVIVYQWNTTKKTYEVVSNTKFPLVSDNIPTNSDYSIKSISSIGKNKFCCHFETKWKEAQGTQIYLVLLEIDPVSYNIKHIGEIKPDNPDNKPASIMVLPNHQLLTWYDWSKLNKTQLWDTTTLECIKSWKWENFNLSSHLISLHSLPDSIHLLVIDSRSKAFLFDTDKLSVKNIEFDFFNSASPNYSRVLKLDVYTHQKLMIGNGKILILMKTNQCTSQHAVIDLEESAHFRNKIVDYKMSKTLVQTLFKPIFPAEISNQIIDKAFNPQEEHRLAIMARDEIQPLEESKNSCSTLK